ncbi:uncharacterized protein VICG_01528 [Vittaforma corneae ATCC 50505]|uniref:Uncharacterized protein n=1 Tax=Vittaforma corneae (strain ATCC 50505) TaxID=993615 RepID=L2GKL0_VITCO|nr:uncharacterized protein VICG_01528 [Vittaforma corneae ATCC 50505]ELA41423.1 hypothetical protein VICG_01528 [Vittaforma corneae ATCC 50505]
MKIMNRFTHQSFNFTNLKCHCFNKIDETCSKYLRKNVYFCMLFLNIPLVKGLSSLSLGPNCESTADTSCENKVGSEYSQTNISQWPNNPFTNIPALKVECSQNIQNQQNTNCAGGKASQQFESCISSIIGDQMVMNDINNQIECLEQYADNANINLDNAFSGVPGSYDGRGFYNNYLKGGLGYSSNGFYPHGGHRHMEYPPVPKMITGKTNGIPGTNVPFFVKDKITAVVTSVVTNVVEKPPVTVIPPPQTVTFTRHAKPITKTLPPLVFQIPTTIIQTSKPETIIKTLPPQVIYQPPETKTLQQQVHYPPSTIVINKTLNPVTRTVVVPGPARTYVQPPQTVVSVSTKVIMQPHIPPAIFNTAGNSVPGRVNPFSHNHSRNTPFDHSYHPDGFSHYGGHNGHYPGTGGGSPYSGKFNGQSPYPGGHGYPYSGGYNGGVSNIACDCYELGKVLDGISTGNTSCSCPQQSTMQFNLPYFIPGSPDCTINNLTDCQRPSVNNCLKNTNNCYTSMLQSNYNLQSNSDQCSVSNVKMCESDNWPKVMEPNSSKSTNSSANKPDKTREASSEEDVVSASLVSSGKEVPKAVFVSDLTKQNE